MKNFKKILKLMGVFVATASTLLLAALAIKSIWQNYQIVNTEKSTYQAKPVVNSLIVQLTDLKPETTVQTTPQPTPVVQTVAKKQTDLKTFYSKQTQNYEAKKQKQAQINQLTNYLKKQGSPIATTHYAEMIINLANQNKADYRIIVAIMGVESGFCRANYKKYNCFGYLNKVQYANFDEAITALVPKISKQYANKYGTNFYALAKAYGMLATDYQSKKLAGFYSALH